jgi:hypothetical protein
MTTTRDIGDLERIGNHAASGAAAFTALDGTATDPTAVALSVRKPDGTLQVYGWPSAGTTGPLTREATGRFYADVLLDQAGEWTYHLAGTGTVTAAAQGYLVVARDWTA